MTNVVVSFARSGRVGEFELGTFGSRAFEILGEADGSTGSRCPIHAFEDLQVGVSASNVVWLVALEPGRSPGASLFGHLGYWQAALDGRLHRASTQTATDHAGHVEGALAAGRRAAEALTRHPEVSHARSRRAAA